METFAGPAPPGARVTFGHSWGSDQTCVYEVKERINGAEILYGEEGVIQVAPGKLVVGLVGAPTWDETLLWIEGAMGLNEG